jgi:hypothetical protein
LFIHLALIEPMPQAESEPPEICGLPMREGLSAFRIAIPKDQLQTRGHEIR